MDCPWCGCGWLFTCITCRKAFTFAVGIEIDATWEQLAREDIRNCWGHRPSKKDITEWIAAMREILANVKDGKEYVILDGMVIPTSSKNIEFDGWYAHHKVKSLPQVDALSNAAVLEKRVGNRDYWEKNALPCEE
jgi:hypothetical protein